MSGTRQPYGPWDSTSPLRLIIPETGSLRKGWPESNLRSHTHGYMDFCDRLEDGTVEGTPSEPDVSPPSSHKVPGDIPMLFKRKLSSPFFFLRW